MGVAVIGAEVTDRVGESGIAVAAGRVGLAVAPLLEEAHASKSKARDTTNAILNLEGSEVFMWHLSRIGSGG